MSALVQAIPEGFKQTDVGAIPENWKSEQLFELVKVIDGDRGQNYPSANDFFADGYCVFLSASNVTKKGFSFKDTSFINKTKDEALRKGKLKRNDIVLTTRGTVGQYAFYDEAIGYEHLRINSGMVLVRVISKEIKPDYLYSVLKSHIVQKQLSTMSFGSAQPQLTVRDINNFIVCYPSCSKEQTVIANALSDVDALLTELENLIAKKQAIKTATMQQLLTGKTRLPKFATYTEGAAEGKSKGTKPSELGEIPEDWGVISLRKISENIMVGIASAATHAYRDRGIPFLRNQNILPNMLDDKDVLYITPQYEITFQNKRLKSGDLLTARTGYPGTTCIVPDKFEGAQSFTTLITRLKKGLSDPRFVCFYMNSEAGEKFFELNQIGGGQKNVNSAILKTLPLPFPSLEEQTAIATILSDMDNEIQTLEQRLTKTRQVKQGMMQQLLTGRTRLPFNKEAQQGN